jgi:hypothetical protein
LHAVARLSLNKLRVTSVLSATEQRNLAQGGE